VGAFRDFAIRLNRQLIEPASQSVELGSPPLEFYRRYLGSWEDLARRIVETTMSAMQPADAEPEKWRATVEAIAQRVAVGFIQDENEVGISFTITPRVGFDPTNENPGTFTLGNLSIQDVLHWIEAGHGKSSPDEPGKNLGEVDAGKTDLQIAWRVMYALKLQKPGWDRLLDALRDFVGFEATSAADALYPELLKAWFAFFSDRAPQAWQRYWHELAEGVRR
jgi:hypothetical protein